MGATPPAGDGGDMPAWEDRPGGDPRDGDENTPPDFYFEDSGFMPDDFDSPAPPGDDADFDTLSQGIDHIPAPIPVLASERTKTKAPRFRASAATDRPRRAAAVPVTGLAAGLAGERELLGAQS